MTEQSKRSVKSVTLKSVARRTWDRIQAQRDIFQVKKVASTKVIGQGGRDENREAAAKLNKHFL